MNTGATKKSRMESSGSEIIRPVVEDQNADEDNSKRVACGRDMEEEEEKSKWITLTMINLPPCIH